MEADHVPPEDGTANSSAMGGTAPASLPKAAPSALHQGRSEGLQKLLLAAAGLTCLIIMAGWIYEPFSAALPSDWSQMKAMTATSALLSVVAIVSRGGASVQKENAIALTTPITLFGLAAVALLANFWEPVEALERAMAFGDQSSRPGHMSTQTAGFFATISLAMMYDYAASTRATRRKFLGGVSDLLVVVTFIGSLTVISGILFGATALFAESNDIRTSRYTAFCMLSLATAACIERSWRGGYLAPLVGAGEGDRLARAALPLAVAFPAILVGVPSTLRANGVIGEPASFALSTAAMSATLLVLVRFLISRINRLESTLLERSVTDHLTTVCNHRGFFEFGEKLFEVRKANNLPLTVLYFDLDGLKAVNDEHGHDVGSEMVTAFAGILRNAFPKEDVVGRVGGDEFAVIVSNNLQQTQTTLAKLETLSGEHPADPRAKWKISYSVGWAFPQDGRDETLDDLVARADQMMYTNKRQKKDSASGTATTGLSNILRDPPAPSSAKNEGSGTEDPLAGMVQPKERT